MSLSHSCHGEFCLGTGDSTEKGYGNATCTGQGIQFLLWMVKGHFQNISEWFNICIWTSDITSKHFSLSKIPLILDITRRCALGGLGRVAWLEGGREVFCFSSEDMIT